jgi:hypothetical protein
MAARHPDGLQHPVQQLPCRPDKGPPLKILLAPRRLAHDHHPRARVAIGKDEIPRPLAQVAQIEPRHPLGQCLQRRGPGGQPARGLDRVGCCQRHKGRSPGGGHSPRGLLGRRIGQGIAVDRRVKDGLVRAKFDLPFKNRACRDPVHTPIISCPADGWQGPFAFCPQTPDIGRIMLTSPDPTAGIAPDRLAAFARRESKRYAKARPQSRAAIDAGASPWLDNVPMHWMKDWPQPFPMVVAKAQGASITDIDGNTVDDFCLGDTGSMFGHSPAPVARALRHQARRGLTYMLPTEQAFIAGGSSPTPSAPSAGRSRPRPPMPTASRSASRAPSPGDPASLSSRAAITAPSMTRWSRWTTTARRSTAPASGPGRRPAPHRRLRRVQRSCVGRGASEGRLHRRDPDRTGDDQFLHGPARARFPRGLRRLATQYGALLIIDETHTISTGHGGYTRTHGLSPTCSSSANASPAACPPPSGA